ncbi:MAG: VUT family protein, partial [Anaerolineae bacterium]|nr:VUT family protein [Anaerolineae bacterium]
LIGAGSVLSWVLNRDAGQIAMASFVAFACAGVADAIVYHLLGDRARMLKINGSNVVSAGVDSFVFPALAFGFPLLWGVMLGQFAAKVGGG